MVNKNQIKIERIEPPKLDVYTIDNQFVGTFNNEYEFNKFRIEMVRNLLADDYYFMWNDIRITVDNDGDMSSFPRGLYDLVQQDLATIFKIVKNRKL